MSSDRAAKPERVPRSKVLPFAESPIESALINAIFDEFENDRGDGLALGAQVDVGRYCADLVIYEIQGMAVLVVECDGHDFHDRTKAQAAHDRRRDREILDEYGIVTVRFTGSEIYADAHRCAQYCLSVAKMLSYDLSLVRVGERCVFEEAQ